MVNKLQLLLDGFFFHLFYNYEYICLFVFSAIHSFKVLHFYDIREERSLPASLCCKVNFEW